MKAAFIELNNCNLVYFGKPRRCGLALFLFPQKGEVILPSNVRFSSGSDGSLYVVSPGGEESGEYVCTATNAAGYATRKVQLTVYGGCHLISAAVSLSPIQHWELDTPRARGMGAPLVSAFGSPNQAVLYMADPKRLVLQPLLFP